MKINLKSIVCKFKGLNFFGIIITTKKSLENMQLSAKGIEAIK